MAAAKQPKKSNPSSPKTQDDDNEEVLFEGELTWTHEPLPASPELLKRTPRDESPSVKKTRPPASEGLISLQDASGGGGEIFSNTPVTPWAPQEDGPVAEASAAQAAPKAAETSSGVASASSAARSASSKVVNTPAGTHTVLPLNDIKPATTSVPPRMSAPETASAASPSPAQRNASGPVAGEFLPSSEESVLSSKRRLKWVLIGIGVLFLLIVAAVIAYVTLVVPRQPGSIFAQSLANSLQKQSVEFALSAQQLTHSGSKTMQVDASGGISQAGSYDMTAKLRNRLTPSPITMSTRSIDGGDSYVRFDNLTANQAYVSKLGVANSGAVASIDNKWLSMPADVRATIFESLGLNKDTKLAPDASAKRAMTSAYTHYPFLSVSAVLPDASIDAVSSYHYRLAINKTQLTAFAIALKGQSASAGLTQRQIDAANALDTNRLKLEVWIAKPSRMINQMSVSRQNEAGRFDWTMRLSHYDETVGLQQPTAQADIVSAIKPLISPTATDADATALVQKITDNYAMTASKR